MNHTQLIGRICRPIIIKTTANQSHYVRNTLALNHYDSNGKKRTDFIPFTAWNALADTLAKYQDQGDEIGISGHLSSGHYTNQKGEEVYTLEVVCEAIDFLRKKQTATKNSGRVPFAPETEGIPVQNIEVHVAKGE
ncbi:MAG: single-stranded DNA-binding protein [Aerococcus sp.]|nr:single-stranded DNA-binding protein [Aerococcus sp.]